MQALAVSTRLAGILGRHAAAIRDDWARALRADPDSHYVARPFDDVATWTARGLTAVRRSLLSGDRRPLEVHVARVVSVRRRLGFEIGEVIRGLLALKQAALPYLFTEAGAEASPPQQLIAALDAVVDTMVAEFGHRFSSAVRERVEKERLRTVHMLEAVERVTATLDPDAAMDHAVRRIRAALDARFCAMLLRERAGSTFRTRAEDGAPPSPRLRTLLARPVDAEAAPGLAAVIRLARTRVLREADTFLFAEGETCGSLGLGELVVVPIVSRGRVVALTLAARDRQQPALGSDRLRLAQGIASAVGPAIENARLHAALRRRLGETRTLHEMSSSLLEEGTLTDMLDLVSRECQRLLRAEGAAVLLRDDDGRWSVAAEVGHLPPESLRLGLEPAVPTDRSEPVEPVLFDDEGNGPCALDAGTTVAMPLRIAGRFVGVLQVVRGRVRFEPEDLHLLARIANQAAIAIEHERLHDRQEQARIVEERQRLSRDLHDSVSQSLYGVMMFAEAAARLVGRDDGAGARRHLEELREAAQQALWEMRLLIFELHPPDLSRLGLEAALQARLSTVEHRAGLSTEFRCADIGRLPASVEHGLYRVVQEALNNAIRHSGATRVSVRLERDDSGVGLEFADNGVGFDQEEVRLKGGLGLVGMRERAATLGGRIEIDSRPGEGTRIALVVPLPTTDQPRGAAAVTPLTDEVAP